MDIQGFTHVNIIAAMTGNARQRIWLSSSSERKILTLRRLPHVIAAIGVASTGSTAGFAVGGT